MRRVLSLVAFSAVFSMLALAENWSGRLLDATCYSESRGADACDATGTTAAFALSASGKVFKLDATGNSKAATALRNRADRSDPAKPQAKQVMAKVEGTERGGTIAVTAIEVQ
jgi:hypothetical protein